MRILIVCGLLAGLLGCANTQPGATPDEARTGAEAVSDMVTSLEVDVGSGTVRFVLHVTNQSAQPIRLEFPSAQRYDFVVQGPTGSVLWRWSDDQMFAQMLGEETIPAGGTRDFSATWQSGSVEGVLTAIGRVTATNRPLEQRTEFEIRKR